MLTNRPIVSPLRRPWTSLAAAALLLLASQPVATQATDSDGDGLPDAWETQFGLDPNSAVGANGAQGDPDLDNQTNAVEFAAGTHPRGFYSEWFAEGATGVFFDERLALFNPDPTLTARAWVRFLPSNGAPISVFMSVAPHQRLTVDPEQVAGLQNAAFSAVVESDVPLAVDRTMKWDARHYGSHTETGAPRPSSVWYLAEGATHSGFDLFYLFMNPNPTEVAVQVSYLLPSGAPIVKTYNVPAQSRFNVWVDNEDARLAATDVSAVINSSAPIVVERSMYLGTGGLQFGAGHTSMGVTAPALTWFLAEGATGDFFDLFVLVANPNTDAANVEARYLLPSGTVVTKNYTVAPRSRFNIWVDLEDGQLASTSVSTTVTSTNNVPIIVERSMWWPGGGWQEAHNSPGTTSTARRWALAEGEVGGADNSRTYVLIANTSSHSGQARVVLYFEDGSAATVNADLSANSRFTLDVAARVPQAAGKRFGAVVESSGPNPIDLVVERAVYSDAGGVTWAAGTNALAMPVIDGTISGTQSATSGTVSLVASPATGDEGTQSPGAFTLTRSNGTGAMIVPFTIGGTATPGQDYRAIVGTFVLPAGVTTATVPVMPVDDLLSEGNETVTITLAPGPGYTIAGPSAATVTIVDNDAGQPGTTLLNDAARFLTQTTFGPTLPEVDNVSAVGFNGWLESQFSMAPTLLTPFLDRMGIVDKHVDQRHVQEGWFTNVITGPDQLRQRVSAALLEILVVGDSEFDRPTYAMSAYWDLLQNYAFGNFRSLLEAVTLSPTMGEYLDMLHADKEDPATGRSVSENYGRELLQLFTIGLYQMNLDGTLKRDSANQLIPTYGQDEVKGFARAFTGWYFHQDSHAQWNDAEPDWLHPMMAFPTHHSTGTKQLLNGVVTPANQTPEKDLKDALDNVFNHPNVGPFIGKQLIQRLVTGNPSPAYVARVATVFNDNGRGVRGDLRAVVKAILTDHEARDGAVARGVNFGKQKEPMIRFASILRSFAATSPSGRYGIWDLQEDMGQAPFRSPSVFNFFRPTYARPGPIADAGLVSPEFQITTEGNVISAHNTMRDLVWYGYNYDKYLLTLNFSAEQALAGNPDALLDRLNALLMAGAMSTDLRATVREAILAVPARKPKERVQMAVQILLNSPEFIIQK